MDKPAWKHGAQQPMTMEEMLEVLHDFLQLPHLQVARNYFSWTGIWQSYDTYQSRPGSTIANRGHKLLIDVQIEVVTYSKDGYEIRLVDTSVDSGRMASLQ
jgi:hypothetical protein